MRHRPTICILDDNPERCLREEAALDAAILQKSIYAHGISNYGGGHIARSGMEEHLPVIEVDGRYFIPPKKGEELTKDVLCRFLDMLVKEGIVQRIGG